MHMRASTPQIAAEYKRLQEKHCCKDRGEYKKWLNETIINRKSFVTWVLQWIYYNTFEKEHKYIDIFGQKKSIEKKLVCIYEEVNKINLDHDIKEFSVCSKLVENQAKLATFVKKYVISYKNYIRLRCTHNAFCMFENIMHKSDDIMDVYRQTKKLIWGLIIEKFNEIDAMELISNRIKLWMKAEWFMSYVKVISRKQLARYYHVRKAIYQILLELAMYFINEANDENVDIIGNLFNVKEENHETDSVMPEMKLKIFMLVICRLSAMHSSFVIENADKVYDWYEKCRKQYQGTGEYSQFYDSETSKSKYHKYIRFQSPQDFVFNITKLIKWTSESGYDDSKCFFIEEQFREKIFDESGDNQSEYAQDLYRIVFLENVQIIYDGIKRLLEDSCYDEDDENNCTNLVRCIQRVISKTNIKKEHRSTTDKYDCQYLKTSATRYFFQFMDMRGCYRGTNQDDYDHTLLTKYANMCCCMQKLRKLSVRKDTVDNPYDYEKLCNYIRDIMGYEQCMIFYCDVKVYQLAVSSFDQKYIKKDLKMAQISKLINEFKSNNSGRTLIDQVVQMYYDIEEYGEARNTVTLYLLINIPVQQNSIYILLCKTCKLSDDRNDIVVKPCASKCDEKQNKGDTGFDIIKKEEWLDYETLWNVRNILFLRNKLECALKRDMIALKNMFRRYDYVEAINGDICRILHISDLHVSKNNKNDLIQKIQEASFEEEGKCKTYDLILITGDVINGAYTATDLTDNYDSAIEVIKELVIKIWGKCYNGRTYVRGDWRKRIVISTGNHDYASMNELEALNKHRATLSGTVSGRKGNSMVKYSYFINFLHNLLGTDIDDALRYDLTESIRYDKLHTTIVNINTNSGVNPYRTNKVKIDSRSIKRVFAEKIHEESRRKGLDAQQNVIYMMHHTPLYKINYLDDSYYLKSNLIASAESVLNDNGISGDPNEVWIKLVAGITDNFVKFREVYSISIEPEKLMKDLLNKFYQVDKIWFKEASLFDFKYFLEVETSERTSDDKCHKIISKLKEQIEVSNIDQTKYINFVKDYFVQESKPYLITGGHTHRAAQYCGKKDNALKNCQGIIEAAKFFDGTNGLRYNEIEFKYAKPEVITCKIFPENSSVAKIDDREFPISEIIK